jgi:hypothetical protein
MGDSIAREERTRHGAMKSVSIPLEPHYVFSIFFSYADYSYNVKFLFFSPLNLREAIHATTWPSPDPSLPPIYVPAGAKYAYLFTWGSVSMFVFYSDFCRVPYSVLMMHRRKDLWGPDGISFSSE